MNNTEKKLDALIDALGFDVELGAVEAGELICNDYPTGAFSTREIRDMYPDKHIKSSGFDGNWIVSESIQAIKLTDRKPATVPIEVLGDEWSGIVNFVINNQENIEQGVNDFGDLKPILDFMVGCGNA